MKMKMIASNEEFCTYVVRLIKGEEVMHSLVNFGNTVCNGEHFATVSGIGSVKNPKLGFYEQDKYIQKDLIGTYEVLNMTGNITQSEGTVFPHIHITLSNYELKSFGGHLFEATTKETMELIITVYKTKITRRLYNDTGSLKMIKIP